jgi:alkanesulfonate monooxygenase SsuD/methylene tetrahydromethanopterin reductase-like flavin-dependent oxidoreductase (luciferase family)
VRLLLTSDQPVSFSGEFYELHDAIMLPRPQRPGGPPILVGGNGKRSLRLAAKYATEWNGTSQTPEGFREQMRRLDEYMIAEGRQPREIERSAMLRTIFGRTQAEVEQRIAETGYPRSDWLEYGALVGEGDQILEQLGRLAATGCQQVMLQWLYLDDLDGIEALAKALLPHAASL